jgi:PmbA protein
MNNKERTELAGWVITRAKNAGADEVAVDIGGSRDIEIEYRENMLEKLKESKSNYLSLDIYSKHKYSSHSTNDLKKESLGKFIDEAVAMTKYLTEDEYRALPDPKYYTDRKNIDLQLRDGKYESLQSEARVKMAEEIAKVAMAQSDKVISCTSSVGDSLSEGVKVHSNGFQGGEEKTSYYVGAEVTVRDGESGRPQDYYYRTVRFLEDIDNLDFIAKEATRRAMEKIGQAKMPSGVYDMLIENRAASRLLYYLQGAMTGSALQQKQTFLDGMLDKKIASEKLTIIDDPFIIGGLGSKLYDGEGMSARKRVIIDKGILKSFLINNYYARKMGVEPTGGSTSNIVFEYGSRSLDEMVAAMKKGILVTGFIGGNSNSTTGDFSVGIVGLYVEDGRIVKPVNEMNVAGNQKELWNQLVEVGNDPYIYSSMRRPSLYFKDVQFSGI